MKDLRMDEEELTAEVNIERIMQQIRNQILARKTAVSGHEPPIVNIEGKRLPPDFYEHLYQAGLTYDRVDIQMNLTPITIPIIGPILQKIRQKLHELVLFYVNQVAANQIGVNTHLLRALSILSEELENSAPVDPDA
jgi:hypothetical protein